VGPGNKVTKKLTDQQKKKGAREEGGPRALTLEAQEGKSTQTIDTEWWAEKMQGQPERRLEMHNILHSAGLDKGKGNDKKNEREKRGKLSTVKARGEAPGNFRRSHPAPTRSPFGAKGTN